MPEKIFSLETNGQCSINALIDAYQFFFRSPVDAATTSILTRMATENGQLSVDMGNANNSHAFARSLNVLLEGSELIGIPLKAIGLNRRSKALLSTSEYDYLHAWRNIMTTEILYPPCYVISGNGQTRHAEFIPDHIKLKEYVENIMPKYGDNIESIVQLGS